MTSQEEKWEAHKDEINRFCWKYNIITFLITLPVICGVWEIGLLDWRVIMAILLSALFSDLITYGVRYSEAVEDVENRIKERAGAVVAVLIFGAIVFMFKPWKPCHPHCRWCEERHEASFEPGAYRD